MRIEEEDVVVDRGCRLIARAFLDIGLVRVSSLNGKLKACAFGKVSIKTISHHVGFRASLSWLSHSE